MFACKKYESSKQVIYSSYLILRQYYMNTFDYIMQFNIIMT